MRWTRFRIVTLACVLIMALLMTFGLMLRHEPEFYWRVAVPPGPQRVETSNRLLFDHVLKFYTKFYFGDDSLWTSTFTQEQLNSYFAEDFIRQGDAKNFSDIGISDIRIEFIDDQIRLAFRYGTGAFSSVISYDLKAWLVPSEMNALAIEIQRRRAGAIPIPTQQIFRELKEIGREKNIDIDWYRYNGNPVAIVKFQADRPRPTAQLLNLQISSGELKVIARSFDPERNPNPNDEQIKKPAAPAPGGP
jgi:hypothetical protein